MLKSFAPFVLVFAFLLSSCSAPSPKDTAGEIHDLYANINSVSTVVSLKADYGDKAYIFKLGCNLSPDGGEITIKEPLSVAGVTARIESDGITLTYDGAEVYTGAILPSGLSPVDAVPVMAKAWREGLITETVSEPYGDIKCLSVTHLIDEGVYLKTWFEAETYLPVHAEFSSDGYTVIICNFENVILE